MTEQERLAREWATTTTPQGDMRVRAAIAHIMSTTTPPTMAEIGWEDGEHYFAGAVDEDGDEVVMLGLEGDNIRVVDAEITDCGYTHFLEYPKNLTPNGKRYELRDITVSQDEKVGADQAEHPKVLRTVEDYENAPDGTIVAIQGLNTVWIKHGDQWTNGADSSVPSASIARERREVLRWGRWGE